MSNFGKELPAYLDLFRGCASQKIIFEATTEYINRPGAAETLWNFNPEAKIIVIVREPLDYLSSWAHQLTRNTGRWHDVRRDILEGREYTRIRYAEQVGSFLTRFGKSRVKIVVYDDFLADNARVLRELCDFLDIPRPSVFEPVRENLSIGPKNRTLFHIHRLFASMFIYSRPGIYLRSILKKMFGADFYGGVKRGVESVFRRRREEARGILSPEERRKFMETYASEVKKLGALIDRDLISLWRYPVQVGCGETTKEHEL